MAMETIVKQIHERLTKRAFCTVFNNELIKLFPEDTRSTEKRIEKIRAWAREHGLDVAIRNPGIRCTFKKLQN